MHVSTCCSPTTPRLIVQWVSPLPFVGINKHEHTCYRSFCCTGVYDISDEIATNIDVCEKHEIDVGLPFAANFDSLQSALGKAFVLSEPTVLSMDTEPEVAMPLPEVKLEEQLIQIRVGSENGTNAGVLDGRVHNETAHDAEEMFVDGAIGCSAGIKIVGASTKYSGRICFSGVRMLPSELYL